MKPKFDKCVPTLIKLGVKFSSIGESETSPFFILLREPIFH